MRRRSTLVIGTLLAFSTLDVGFAASATRPAPTRSTPAADLQPLRRLLKTPEAQLDLANAKLTIDQQIDPKIDVPGTFRQLDALAAKIKARFPAGATSQTKLELLVTSLSQSGPCNDYRPFSYDLDDPFGKDIRNKLLSTYLRTRRGNCVSMPILLVILGQKLGLDVTLATAPLHVLAKFRNDQGQWINIEATSFGTKRDANYQQELGITPKAMVSGIYLRPLSQRE
jgi:regulator of sirC expression with transglutaminase-like and TPR domain